MLTDGLAAALAGVALANVRREFPRRLDHLLTSAAAEWQPRKLHPAFYGSYDWHSAVHMHWLMVRLLSLHPKLPRASEMEAVLDEHLAPAAIEKELAYLHGPGGATFERPYGWAWLLELQAELMRLDRGSWGVALAPLAAEIARRFEKFLTGSPYPVRAGTHGNTAFACLLALDYSRIVGSATLERQIEAAAQRWYLDDRDYPAHYEPSADDFLSPALVEALLMKRMLPDAEFAQWMARFMPDLGPLSEPPIVYDHADAKHSHLDGLCLSRAWCFSQLGHTELAEKHLSAGLPHVVGGHYNGEHWLASFAALALTGATRTHP